MAALTCMVDDAPEANLTDSSHPTVSAPAARPVSVQVPVVRFNLVAELHQKALLCTGRSERVFANEYNAASWTPVS